MSRELINALQDAACYPHSVDTIQVIETHISWVLLTGEQVYKIKKPVNFGFLDFTSLEQRRFFCHEEIRLNQRLAPQIYQRVVAITGTPEQPQIDGPGEAIEYAVQMRQFDQSALMDQLLAAQQLPITHMDDIALQLANFHTNIPSTSKDSPFGAPEQVMLPVQQNFEQILPLLSDGTDKSQLAALEQWANSEYQRIQSLLTERKNQGQVRECHGDIHLGNIALLQDHACIFDCIEFNEAFRWTDVMADIAFLVMDLQDRHLEHYAHRVLNHYLEHSGDYSGLCVLRFYLAYRAMVRAKVSLFSIPPEATPEQIAAQTQRYRSYATLAEGYSQPTPPALVLMHGVTASGKSTVSQHLVEQLGAIRIRSDVERKRLFGLEADQSSHSALDAGIYTANASEQTYQRLHDLANEILEARFSVVVDATLLTQDQRELFYNLASRLGVKCALVHCHAPQATQQEWLNQRQTDGKDASEGTLAVLEKQLASIEPLTQAEQQHSLSINSSDYDLEQDLLAPLKQKLQ